LVESLLKQKNTPPAAEPDNATSEQPQTPPESPPSDTAQASSTGEPKSEEQQAKPGTEQASTKPPRPGTNEVPGSELGDEQHTTPPMRPASDSIDDEQQQALEQWLRQIPDDPGELLRRKFWYEQQQHQDQGKTR
jgi:Ca-activated chloride channel family protein